MKPKSPTRAARWTPGMKKLKAISIRQPWIWLIVNGYLRLNSQHPFYL
jgi:hypothetical protein